MPDSVRNRSRCQLISDMCRLSASRTLVASLTWLLERYWMTAVPITTMTARITGAADRSHEVRVAFMSLPGCYRTNL